MSDDAKQEADARLGDALADRALEDSRPAYRQRLRELRESNPAAFDRARGHYEDVVVPALFTASDPVEVWIEYGRWLAELTADGRLLAIDRSGRASPYAPDAAAGALVLHIPDDAGIAILPVAVPLEATPAQRASLDLLVHGRVQIDG
ncbi:MAG: hypothetical protein ACRELX_02050 [Longimicrobiales bacterium]